jgi:hypothetical protein
VRELVEAVAADWDAAGVHMDSFDMRYEVLENVLYCALAAALYPLSAIGHFSECWIAEVHYQRVPKPVYDGLDLFVLTGLGQQSVID